MTKSRKSSAQDPAVTIRISRGDLETLRSYALGRTYANLGSLGDEDIMAVAFAVLMEAAKSAQDDLKSIMDGVKAINKAKAGWRGVVDAINEMSAATEGDDCNAQSRGEAPGHGLAARLKNEPVGAETIDGERLVLNAPTANGEIVAGSFVIQGTGTPGGFITQSDIDNAKEIIKNKLDSLSELGEMESLRLQMAMDRLSRQMSSLSNVLKKISDTTTSIAQNVK